MIIGQQFQHYLEETIELHQRLSADLPLQRRITKGSPLPSPTASNGKSILLAGKGGIAGDAQHLATEFVVRFNHDRPAISALALTVDSSMLTAIGNDYGFEHLFSRQLHANGRAGDVFIGITTSGNSANIVHATKTAKDLGITTIALCGQGGALAEISDIVLAIPHGVTSHIQEAHIVIGHFICAYVEQCLFSEKEN